MTKRKNAAVTPETWPPPGYSLSADGPVPPAAPAPTLAALTNLAGIAQDVQTENSRQVQVDISRFLRSRQSVVLTWERPDVRKVYCIADDAGALMLRYPAWKEQMAIDVATIAACHIAPSPGGLAPGLFYATLCESNAELWFYLVQQLGEAFPHLKGIKDQRFLETVLEMCLEFLHRHPNELEGERWDADVLTELKALKDRKAQQSNL